MKRSVIPLLLIIASIALCRIDYQPVSGELLDYWNNGYQSDFPKVYDFDPGNLPTGICELRMTGIEIEMDSLDIYLLGIAADTDIPYLLATGGYRGEHNFAKSYARYDEEEDRICLSFQMPFSARYCQGCYRWNIEERKLVFLEYITADPSLDAMERIDTLLAEGSIAEAIDELNNIFYPGNYYSSDEMIARLLRSINRVAGDAEAEGNFEEAVSLFGELADFLHTDREWYTAFTDSLDYVSCNFAEYMNLNEYAMIMNNYAYYLEQTDYYEKSLTVLRKVLDLQPDRMVAHLNIADVLWKLDARVESEEHYSIYVDMMTGRELTHQIPAYVHERLAQLHAVTVTGDDAGRISAGPVEGMEFAHIPSGHFLMGSPSSEEGHDVDEGPQHRVEISAFELMTTEVTQGMWTEVMGTDLRCYRDLVNPEWALSGEGYYYPMYFISWNDCQKFIAVLNSLDSAHIYRLPTEAEWEYACRAGTNTAYYWADSPSLQLADSYCWNEDNSDGAAHPVAQKEANRWGLYDMSGNLSEWCEDAQHDSYSGAPFDGSVWTGRGDSLRIYRCGNWYFEILHCRSAERDYSNPFNRFSNIGFRVARVERTPEMVVKVFVDAYKNSNGYLLISFMPTEFSDEISGAIEQVMENTENTVSVFASLGIDIAEEEVEYLTVGDLITLALNLDDFFPAISSDAIEIGDAVIDGKTATVPIIIDGSMQELKLINEDGCWMMVNSF